MWNRTKRKGLPSNQRLRHIYAGSRYFAAMHLTSSYHKNPIDRESQDLLVISTSMGRFNYLVLASDIFNYLTDGSMRYDGSQSIKNMEDVLLYGSTLEELKTKLETFLGFCKEKNLKLKPSKMNIGEEVEFAGTVIRADTVENEDVVSILPPD